ncbi:MAG TPA: hypothetical protein PKA41_08945 [Verrucomicrobiota bacterium]|nr:hypothetical protein [Verrucomicrobiota bacterium]
MFGKAELERLRQQKELLVAHSEANRLILELEWRRFRSGKFWKQEATRGVREHPLLSAGLAAGAGLLAVKALRHPGALLKLAGRVSGVGSTLLSVWKLFGRK